MTEKEQILKDAFNAYVDALANFSDEIKALGLDSISESNLRFAKRKYLLDNGVDIRSAVTPAFVKFRAGNSADLLLKKVTD